MSRLRLGLCRLLGHWIVIRSQVYDRQSDALMCRWQCRICQAESASRSDRVQQLRNRQSWVVSILLCCALWGAIMVFDRVVWGP